MIALILGGAPTVWKEAEEAAVLLNRRQLVVAANLAGIHWPDRLDAWASLHTDLLPGWAKERAGEPAGRLFTPDLAPERWSGSSGLYAAQCALFEVGAAAAILCGIPMDSDAGHFIGRDRWESASSYRRAFATALPEIGGRVRSMGGWSAELFGKPTPAWARAIDIAKSAGVSAPERTDMHTVKNASSTTQTFWAPDQVGQVVLHRLEPGETGSFNIDPAQRKFAKGGPFDVTSSSAPAAKSRGTKKRAAPKPAKPAPPATPVSDEA